MRGVPGPFVRMRPATGYDVGALTRRRLDLHCSGEAKKYPSGGIGSPPWKRGGIIEARGPYQRSRARAAAMSESDASAPVGGNRPVDGTACRECGAFGRMRLNADRDPPRFLHLSIHRTGSLPTMARHERGAERSGECGRTVECDPPRFLFSATAPHRRHPGSALPALPNVAPVCQVLSTV